MRVVDSEGIWTRGGVNVEDLPDPFEPLPPYETDDRVVERKRRRWPLVLYAFSAIFFVTIIWLILTAPLSRALQPLDDPAILYLSQEGQPIARRGAIKESPVEVKRLEPFTPAAFVSIEDRRFYHHWGIDPRGIGRAMVANMRAGGVRQGGSTITQQLAKTSFLSSDRSIKRKAQEVIIAFWLEAWLTKDEILSRYLSSVYFGDGVYGLRAAARHYFNRSPEDLTLAQSAMLAGVVQAPSRLAPTHNLALAQKRSRLVLDAMADTGAISHARPGATRLARPVYQTSRFRPAPISPTGSLPLRRTRSNPTSAKSRFGPRSTPTCSGWPFGQSPTLRSAMLRRLWSQCVPTGELSRWSGGAPTPRHRSTAPRSRAGSRDRLSSCSSI